MVVRPVRTKQKDEVMSTLKDLCKSIPSELLLKQSQYNAAKRSAQAYCKRLESLAVVGENAFAKCKTSRPSKKKVQVKHENSCGSYLGVKRFGHTTIVVRKQSI